MKQSELIIKNAQKLRDDSGIMDLPPYDREGSECGFMIQAILDYLDKPTPREDCFRCHNLPEGAVVSGHDHGNLNPLLPPLGTVT